MTLSPETQAALRDAVTREQVLALLLEAGAPVYLSDGAYRVRADILIWLTAALGLSDQVILCEEE